MDALARCAEANRQLNKAYDLPCFLGQDFVDEMQAQAAAQWRDAVLDWWKTNDQRRVRPAHTFKAKRAPVARPAKRQWKTIATLQG